MRNNPFFSGIRTQKGMTLIEVVLAMAVLSIVAAPLLISSSRSAPATPLSQAK